MNTEKIERSKELEKRNEKRKEKKIYNVYVELESLG